MPLFCAITDQGLEKVSLMELDEIIKAKGKQEDSVVLFECKSFDDAFKFCYKAQSIDRILVFLGSFDFKELDDLLASSKKIVDSMKLDKWLTKDSTFKVSCERRGSHDFGSSTIEQDVGEMIIEKAKEELGFEPKVNMGSPEVVFYIFIKDDKAYIGIDLVGRDLSKRQYRIFTAPGIVNAKLAYAMVRLSGYEKKKKMVDLAARSGIICIEAGLFATGISINHYNKDFAFKKIRKFERDWDEFFRKIDSDDKPEKLDILCLDPLLRNLEASKKNAKLAGIDKLIKFSKMDLDWLDIKLEEKSIDLVVSRINCPSHAHSENSMRKAYKELFYQAEFFLKKGGRMCLLAESLMLLKEMLTKDFKIISEDELYAGKQMYDFVMLEKI